MKIGDGSLTVKGIINADGSFVVPTITPDNYDYYLGYDEITNNTAGKTVNVVIQAHISSRIQNTADDSKIIGGLGNDSLNNTGQNASIDMGNGNNYVENQSKNSTIQTSSGDDVVLLPTAENGNNYVNTGGGADFVYNNGPDSTIDGGDGDDNLYGCPTSKNNLFKGGKGNDYIHAEGDNTKTDGGAGNDMLANGDNDDVGDDIQDRRDKAQEDADEFLEKLKDTFGDEFENDPTFKDVLENGADSEYIKHLSKNEREAIADLLKTMYDVSKQGLSFGEYFAKLEAEGYEPKIQRLENLIDERINYAKVNNFEEKFGYYRDRYRDQTIRMNRKSGKLLLAQNNVAKLATKLSFIGKGIETFEFGYAVGNALTGKGSWENVLLEGVDVAAAFIPIPGVDFVAAAGRAAVSKIMHSDADFWATFGNNLNLDHSTK
ncbi:MAG: hypothetical protein SR1Q7_02510 [Quinella sp. 1Q7]|nr:hypothetical protein [Quinella sp. 1Q7]